MALYYKELHAGYLNGFSFRIFEDSEENLYIDEFNIKGFNNYPDYPYTFIFPNKDGLSFPNYTTKERTSYWFAPINNAYIRFEDGALAEDKGDKGIPWELLTEENYEEKGWFAGDGLKANLKTLFNSFSYPSWWKDTLIVKCSITIRININSFPGHWPEGTKLIAIFYYPGNQGEEL